MKNLVIIPTYNEAETIGLLIERLLKLSPQVDILVIDDNSEDGTIDIVKSFMNNNSSVRMIVRTDEKGLGTALLRGYHEAIKDDYDVIIQMDADLQHPPEIIPKLIRAIEDGFDVAVASRYIKGGGTEGWSWYRRMISKVANYYARVTLGLETNDVTTGFRAFSNRALKYLISKQLRSKGFLIQVETLYILEKAGFRISEYPFIFKSRFAGRSKLKLRVIFEFFISIPIIKFRRY